MKYLIPMIGWVVLYFSSHQSDQVHTINVDGLDREYILFVPENLPENAPLVMVFHGYSGTAAYANSYFNMEDLANEHGFVVAYPQGTLDQVKNPFWQVGYTSHKSLEVDDVEFVTQLAQHLQSQYSLNSLNTFIVGFSNGGDLCNKLICERPEYFKAAAPIISCMMDDMYNQCKNVVGKPIFMLNGTADDITLWDGDMADAQGFGSYHSTLSMLDLRVRQNQATLTTTETIPSASSEDKTSITINKYAGANANQVWMYQINGGGHGHPDYLDLQHHVWKFFSLYLD